MKEVQGQWIVKTPIGLFYGPFKTVGPAEAWAQKEMAGGNWCLMQLRPPLVSAKKKAVIDAGEANGVPFPKSTSGMKIVGGRVMTGGKGVRYFLAGKEKGSQQITVGYYEYIWSKKYGGYIFA